MDFGTEVRRRRRAAKLTLEDLAERASLTPNYLGTIETGKRDPSLSTVLALAKALKVRPGELLGPLGDGLSGRATEAARLIDEVPEPVAEGVLQVLRAVRRRR